MESWRKAWKGSGAPVEPFEDREWVERRRKFLEGMSDPDTASDEGAGEEYRRVQALWLLDHVDVLEEAGEITPEYAAQLRRAMRMH